MTGRLQELREQRDLIAKHLQWIEGEISAAQPSAALEETAAVQPDPTSQPQALKASKPPFPAVDPEPVVASALAGDPDETTKVRGLQSQVRRGCLVYFGLAWLVLGAVVGAIYLAYS